MGFPATNSTLLPVKNLCMKIFQGLSEPATVSEVFGSTVQEQAAIVKRWTLVVVQQTFLPHFPGFCVLQLGNGSVEKCNRSS